MKFKIFIYNCNSFNIILFLVTLFYFQNSFSAQFTALKKLEKNGIQISAMIVKLKNADVIAELNPDKRLSPASTSKLVLAAQALELWGANKTFLSEIYMRGKLNNGVLNGDLIFYGNGDPYLTNEKLWYLTSDVARYGIKKVTGNVIVNNSYFGKIPLDENRESGQNKSQNAYDSPLSSAAVNFSVLGIVINPGQSIGKKAIVSIEPFNLPHTKVTNLVTTGKANSSPQLQVKRSTEKGKDTFLVSGNIPLNYDTQRIYRSISNADYYAGHVINSFLKSIGISTTNSIIIEGTPLKKSDFRIAQVESYSLDWQLKGLFKVSNNFIGDMLTLQLIRNTQKNTKKISLSEGGKYLQNYVTTANKESPWGEIKNQNIPIVMESGSGLTPNNRLSARDIISVLDRMYFSGRDFPVFLSALPMPGEIGTLKNRFTLNSEKHLHARLRAKTGTLTEPVSVNAIGGYSRLKNGDWISFAIIANGIKSKPQIEIQKLREAIDMDLANVLPAEL